MGLAVSWECWDAGSSPGPAQWVKDPVLPQLWLTFQLQLRSDPWPRELHMPWGGQKWKKKKKGRGKKSKGGN